MTDLATPTDYTKEYLPGYTGHVPSKNERFGASAGQIQREILGDGGKHPIVLEGLKEKDEKGRLYSSAFVPSIDKNKIIFGNRSRYAKNWINGPNHEIRNQQVPGYTGHIKGLVSENLFAGSYANCTSQAIGKKHAIGYDLDAKNRFNSLYTSKYKSKNFRRFGKLFFSNHIADNKHMQPRKDYDDYLRFVNDTYAGEMVDFMNS